MMRVRRLVWLRWQLLTRGLGQGRAQRIATGLFLLGVVPAAVLFAWLTVQGYRRLPSGLNGELLAAVLGALWLAWALGPVWSVALNQGLDADRLQPYPLGWGELAAGLALAALVDLWSLPALAFLGAAAVAWVDSPAAALIVVPALLLLYLHLVAAGQVVTNAFAGVLRSRRWRDAVIFLSAIVGSSFWLIQQAAFRNLNGVRSLEQIASLRPRGWLRLLPPGWTAEAILAARAGDWTAAAGWLLALILGLALLFWGWVGLIRRLGQVTAGGWRAPRTERAGGRRGVGWPHGRVWSVARKDLVTLWRDPVQRAQLFTSLAPLVWLAAPIFAGGGLGRAPGFAPLLVALVPVWTARDLASNAFGWERGGLPALLALPAPPARVLAGKNVAVAAVALAEAALLSVPLTYLARDLLPIAAAALPPLLLATLATGNVLAVTAPRPVYDRARRPNANGGAEGCAQALVALGALGLQLLLIAPVAAAAAGPLVTGHPDWLPAALAGAYVYAAGLYAGLLRWSARRLGEGASEILERCVQPG